MSVNGQEIISAETGFRAKVNLKGAEQLNLDMWDGSISFVKYVAKNTVLSNWQGKKILFQKPQRKNVDGRKKGKFLPW